jgi:FAD/FMN-containing dehydrogenase
VWNGLFDRRPAAIVRATAVDDVQRAVGLAAEAEVPLAIRGGGHSFPGHSTCDAGVLLDLSGLFAVDIDATDRTALVGGGALLGDVDAATKPFDAVVPAGVVSHTGAGGLTLGGGMGWNSRRYGLTIDNLLGVQLVLADGTLLTVNEDSDPDLFWAIRGGGGNFGVATSFRFQTRPMTTSAASTSLYSAGQADAILSAYAEQVADAPRELSTGFMLARDTLRMKAIWYGSPQKTNVVLGPFSRLGGASPNETVGSSFWELQHASDEALPWGRRYYAKGGFLRAIDSTSITWLTQCLSQAPNLDCDVYVIHLGGAVADVPEDATAYTGRAASFYWVVNGVWDDPEDDETCISWGRQTAEGLSKLSLAGNYVNEQSDVSPEATRLAYGDRTYERLVSVKQRYDPTNLFRLNQNIRP